MSRLVTVALGAALAAGGCNSDEKVGASGSESLGTTESGGGASVTQGSDSMTMGGSASDSATAGAPTEGGSISGSASQTSGATDSATTSASATETGGASITSGVSDTTVASDSNGTMTNGTMTNGTMTNGTMTNGTDSGGQMCAAEPEAGACTKCAAENCQNGGFCECANAQGCVCLLDCLESNSALELVTCAINSGCGVGGLDPLNLPASLAKINASLDAIIGCDAITQPGGACGAVCPAVKFL